MRKEDAVCDNRDIDSYLDVLALRPPQALLIEGGSENKRLATALYWACLANCENVRKERDAPASPCGQCAICRQIKRMEFMDLHIYDGRISNREDEDNPGLIRAMRMENMRDLKMLNTEAPRGNGKRLAIFQGLTQTREEAMNSLLKTLEEPSRSTLFVLLTPQRSQLLPTLVSRSFCLTLPWTDMEDDREAQAWKDYLANFLESGLGFLEKLGGKNSLDATSANLVLASCQKSLCNVLAGKNPESPLDHAFHAIISEPATGMLINSWIIESQEMLALMVNPSRVLEAFASRVFTLGTRKDR